MVDKSKTTRSIYFSNLHHLKEENFFYQKLLKLREMFSFNLFVAKSLSGEETSVAGFFIFFTSALTNAGQRCHSPFDLVRSRFLLALRPDQRQMAASYDMIIFEKSFNKCWKTNHIRALFSIMGPV